MPHLAGEMPLDIVVSAYAFNKQLIKQMLRKIERLATLFYLRQNPILTGRIADAEEETYAARAFVCQSSMDSFALVHNGRCTTTEGTSI